MELGLLVIDLGSSAIELSLRCSAMELYPLEINPGEFGYRARPYRD